MTGHQDHPGTGRTLMGDATVAVSIEDVVRATGIKRLRVIYPYDIAAAVRVFTEETEAAEPSVVISRAPCLLAEKKTLGKPFAVVKKQCKKCGACLRVGCPALESTDKQPVVNADACVGCGICAQMCKFDAIRRDEAERERALT
jgi:indolepyruvate ferredoxin oxidoreductase alpha subunit